MRAQLAVAALLVVGLLAVTAAPGAARPIAPQDEAEISGSTTEDSSDDEEFNALANDYYLPWENAEEYTTWRVEVELNHYDGDVDAVCEDLLNEPEDSLVKEDHPEVKKYCGD